MTNHSWQASILTLLPELFPGPLGYSVVGNALKKGLWKLEVNNIRDFAKDKHKTVDDTSYGGGSGLVLKPDVLHEAIVSCFDLTKPIIATSPRGEKFSQSMAKSFASQGQLQIIAGRFEAIDQRVLDFFKIKEVSIGDYVLSGGDIAAYAILDSCVRIIPSVLSDTSFGPEEESFSCEGPYASLLEYPQYTKPKIWKGMEVPEVLFSGNHAAIKSWRYSEAERLTKHNRRDLWLQHLSSAEHNLKG